MMKTRIIDSFVVGGTPAGPSLPGYLLQRMIGTRISVNIVKHELCVPTPHGWCTACKGDRIMLYDDGTLGVEKYE